MSSPAPGSGSERGLDGLRVLVVEDHPASAKACAMLLRAEGCAVELAQDGRSALERAVAFGPQAVLLDMGLPDAAGEDVARELREGPCREARIVAVTGMAAEDQTHPPDPAIDEWITKPLDYARLRELLSAVPRS